MDILDFDEKYQNSIIIIDLSLSWKMPNFEKCDFGIIFNILLENISLWIKISVFRSSQVGMADLA